MDLIKINQVFKFSKKEIKIIGSIDEPWFQAKESAEVLEYKNTAKAIRDHVRDKNKKTLKELTDIFNMNDSFSMKGNEGSSIYINEAGLYELSFKSKQEAAVQFQDWVFEKVLPEIRKTGSYQLSQKLQEKEKLLLESKEAYEKQKQELEEAKQKNLNLRTIIKNTQIHDYDGYLYFVTNRQYSLENHYRLGRSKTFTGRIKAYANGRTKNDKLYYVFIFKTACVIALEHLFQHLLKPYRDEKGVDMYVISWEILGPFAKRICEKFQTEFIVPANELIQDNLMIESKTTVDNIPKEITPAEYNKFLEEEDNEESDRENEEETEENESKDNEERQENEEEPQEIQENKENEEFNEEEQTIKTTETVTKTVETTITKKLFKCKPCGKYKSYKFFGENAKTDKRHTRCIECRNIKNVNLQINVSELTIYKCLGCLEEKDIDEFEIREKRNELCNDCIKNNIPKQEIIEVKDHIIYKYCNHCKNKYDKNKFYIKTNGEISWICLKCMESKLIALTNPIKNELSKTPRNYRSNFLFKIKSLINAITHHEIFGKPEIKEIHKYRRCGGYHVHEIDRWQLLSEYETIDTGNGRTYKTNTCKKCRRA